VREDSGLLLRCCSKRTPARNTGPNRIGKPISTRTKNPGHVVFVMCGPSCAALAPAAASRSGVLMASNTQSGVRRRTSQWCRKGELSKSLPNSLVCWIRGFIRVTRWREERKESAPAARPGFAPL